MSVGSGVGMKKVTWIKVIVRYRQNMSQANSLAQNLCHERNPFLSASAH